MKKKEPLGSELSGHSRSTSFCMLVMKTALYAEVLELERQNCIMMAIAFVHRALMILMSQRAHTEIKGTMQCTQCNKPVPCFTAPGNPPFCAACLCPNFYCCCQHFALGVRTSKPKESFCCMRINCAERHDIPFISRQICRHSFCIAVLYLFLSETMNLYHF